MSPTLRTCSRNCRAATLIEVLTGLAILGSVTVALILARGNLLQQHADAQLKLEGVRIADQLLAGWFAEESTIPIDETGAIEGYPAWSWRTHLLDAPVTSGDAMLLASILRLELYNAGSPSPQTAIIAVELVTPGIVEGADPSAGRDFGGIDSGGGGPA